jgi:hypothetical protein
VSRTVKQRAKFYDGRHSTLNLRKIVGIRPSIVKDSVLLVIECRFSGRHCPNALERYATPRHLFITKRDNWVDA